MIFVHRCRVVIENLLSSPYVRDGYQSHVVADAGVRFARMIDEHPWGPDVHVKSSSDLEGIALPLAFGQRLFKAN